MEEPIVHQIKLVERGVVTSKCGATGKKITASVWAEDVSCPECLK